MKFSDPIDLFKEADCFSGLNEEEITGLARISNIRRFEKGEYIFQGSEVCRFFHLVDRGLVRVSILSLTGVRMTYLLAGPGEPLNLVGPFTGAARPYAAEALTEAYVAQIKRKDFISFTYENPVVLSNIIGILGAAVDSANSRILDMMDKKVHQRLERVLYTLYRKFGPTLEFTSGELAELAGTTTESTLRAMARFRACGIVRTGRGRIVITKPEILENPNTQILWI